MDKWTFYLNKQHYLTPDTDSKCYIVLEAVPEKVSETEKRRNDVQENSHVQVY